MDAPRKTYKLFIGGVFPRGESGDTAPVVDAKGKVIAQVSLASRKDTREAVTAAHNAVASWRSTSTYERGQALLRIADTMMTSRDTYDDEVARSEAVSARRAASIVDHTVDRWATYSGWCSITDALFGDIVSVPWPWACTSVPLPVGVVGVVASKTSSLLGLVSQVAPVLAGGNTCVVLASEDRPLPALMLADTLSTCGLPPGTVNILTGRTADLGPELAGAAAIDALDLTGVVDDKVATEMEFAAANDPTRVIVRPRREPDWSQDPGIQRIQAFTRATTVWQSISG